MSVQSTAHTASIMSNHETASASLLNRSMPADYKTEQTIALASPLPKNNHAAVCSLMIFRLAEEWFALSAQLCTQVLSPLTAHTVPHRTNDTLLGVVNVRGQMLLKVSLRSLLDLPSTSVVTGHQVYQRAIVLERPASSHATTEKGAPKHAEVWVFDVDELDGIHTIALDTLESPPVSVESSAATCTRRIFLWQDRRVSWLDDTRLFDALRIRAL